MYLMTFWTRQLQNQHGKVIKRICLLPLEGPVLIHLPLPAGGLSGRQVCAKSSVQVVLKVALTRTLLCKSVCSAGWGWGVGLGGGDWGSALSAATQQAVTASVSERQRENKGRKRKMGVSHRLGAVPHCITLTPEKFPSTNDSLMWFFLCRFQSKKNDKNHFFYKSCWKDTRGWKTNTAQSLVGSLWQRNTNEAIWPERQVNEECWLKNKKRGWAGVQWVGWVQDEKAFQAVLCADSCLNKTLGGGSG